MLKLLLVAVVEVLAVLEVVEVLVVLELVVVLEVSGASTSGTRDTFTSGSTASTSDETCGAS